MRHTCNKQVAQRLFPYSEAAAMLGICTKTLDRWAERGVIAQPVWLNGRKYHTAEAIDAISHSNIAA